MRNMAKRKEQQGIALIATLLIVIIFTFIGMSVANNGKKNQEMTGANLRSNIVFEASETSLRKAIRFIRAIRNGEPQAGEAVLTNDIRGLVYGFDAEKAKKHSVQFVTNPAYTFVWKNGAISKKLCQTDTSIACDKKLDFVTHIDNKQVWQYAIKSTFNANDEFDEENYLSEVETYTFIELLRDASVNTTGFGRNSNFTGEVGRGYYYLITVKGSGFPPGKDKKKALGRENVILQAVYAQKY